jgi:excisionase family DNA binding protein
MHHNHPQLTISPQEASKRTGIGLNTLRAHLRSGSLPSVRVGRNYRIRIEVLERWLASLEEAG